MPKQLLLIALGCMMSTVALAEDDLNSAMIKWKSCVDKTAVRYSKSTESAAEVARLAAFSCKADKDLVWKEVKKTGSTDSSADQYVETAERVYLNKVAVDVLELRISK
jgi:hypothetical protein